MDENRFSEIGPIPSWVLAWKGSGCYFTRIMIMTLLTQRYLRYYHSRVIEKTTMVFMTHTQFYFIILPERGQSAE